MCHCMSLCNLKLHYEYTGKKRTVKSRIQTKDACFCDIRMEFNKSVQFWRAEVLMKGVSIGLYHHGHFLQRISSSSELGPVHPILVTAAVMPATVPHAV